MLLDAWTSKAFLSYDWTPNVTVAQDGCGDHLTINNAVNLVPNYNNSRYMINVKTGFYRENVIVSKKKTNVVMFGNRDTKTIIYDGLNRVNCDGHSNQLFHRENRARCIHQRPSSWLQRENHG